jgi:DNA-binding beta-propeller fold protein YncE
MYKKKLMLLHMEETQNKLNNVQTPQKTPRNKRLMLLGLVVVIAALVTTGLVLAFKNKSPVAQSSNSIGSSDETCAPRGTPTCGPDGKTIGSAKASETVKTLETVTSTTIKLTGVAPQGLDIDPDTGYVYVGNNGTIISGCDGDSSRSGENNAPPATQKPGAHTLSIVDPAQGKELTRVDTESAVIWPLVDTKRNVVYTAGSGNGRVGVHQRSSGVKVTSINVGGKPHAFGLSPNGTLIVSNTYDTSQTYMTAINADSRKVTANHKGPEFPHGVAYDQSRNVFYMVGVKTGDVAVVDGSTGVIKETLKALEGRFGNSNMLAWSENKRRLFIADTQNTSSVTAYDVDSKKILGSIRFTETSAPAWGMQVDDSSGLLYAALPNADAVGIADTESLKPLGLIKVDTCPYGVRLDTKRGLAVTANQVNATVSTFKLDAVTKALKR